nr:anthranilate phosphoribosyltransferase [Alphaproteobacteria bacterium]
SPADAGLATAEPSDLNGGDAQENAAMMRGVLGGENGPLRDVVVFNAAASLVVAGKASDLKEGAALAAEAIDSGKAAAALSQLVAITNENTGQ